jgi:hypothetical protein
VSGIIFEREINEQLANILDFFLPIHNKTHFIPVYPIYDNEITFLRLVQYSYIRNT